MEIGVQALGSRWPQFEQTVGPLVVAEVSGSPQPGHAVETERVIETMCHPGTKALLRDAAGTQESLRFHWDAWRASFGGRQPPRRDKI